METEPENQEQKEAAKKILEAINLLPPACKEVFSKSRFEGKKYAEIYYNSFLINRVCFFCIGANAGGAT